MGRVSQEHEVLVQKQPNTGDAQSPHARLHVGDVVGFVGQHACFISVAHP